MLRKILFLIILIAFISSKSFSNEEVFIELKIADKIITNVDIKKEKKYLVALNNNLKKLKEAEFEKLAKNSIIKEKIKIIELERYFDFEKSENFMDEVIKKFYLKLGLNNQNEFTTYLSNYDLKLEEVKYKLKIETLWNQLIFDKYMNKLNINEEDIRKKIIKENKNKKINEFFLREILFELNDNESVEEKYNLIVKEIKENGFENAANLYGISDTAKFGGKIGWVKETQLSNEIVNSLQKIKTGNFSQPINIGNGFLLIKIEKKREGKINFDIEKEIKRIILFERNKKLNQYSNIYFNKVKQKIYFSES